MELKIQTSESKIVMTFHEKFRQYDLGEGHPFRGDRFANAMRVFESQGLFNLREIVLTEPQPAPKEDLLRVHDEGYVDLIFRLANESKPYDIETPVSPEILEAALLIRARGKETKVARRKTKRKINRRTIGILSFTIIMLGIIILSVLYQNRPQRIPADKYFKFSEAIAIE